MKNKSRFQRIAARVLFALLTFASILRGGPVVLTGDSITVSYAPNIPMAKTVAEGGLNAERYVGALLSSPTNYAQNVVDLSPDTIVFMLGANDSVFNDLTDYRFGLFQTHVSAAFDLFDLSSASRVVVLSVLPVDESAIQTTYGGTAGTGMNSRVNDDYNPWLNTQANSRAKFEFVDLNSQMLTNANWRNDWIHPDGLHLNATGQTWLANRVIGVTAVPEPSPICGFVVIGVLWRIRLRLLAE